MTHNFVQCRSKCDSLQQPLTRLPLDAMFSPRVVALIGASERPGSVGRILMDNLCDDRFPGTLYPVHPTKSQVCSRRAWQTIGQVPEHVDLAVIATPAATVPDIVRQCVDAGVNAVVVISAGFRECGERGAELERQVAQELQRAKGRMRLIGPNCLGIAVPSLGLNATFAKARAAVGNVAFLSQSGALCTAILDWSLGAGIGFSAFVSVGSMLDVGWGDLIDYYADDPATKAIAIYMESVGDARSFLSAAREAALVKPIVVIKPGRTAAAAAAAASHTGSMTGSDDVIDAAMQRAGVLRVQSISDLFEMVEVLSRGRRPRGGRLAIITNAGGPAVLAADALAGASGGGTACCTIAKLRQETVNRLDRALPPHWSHGNPIDVLGDATPERFGAAARLAAEDTETDGLLVILTPQAMTDPTATAQQLTTVVASTDKPVLASWMGGDDVAPGRQILRDAGVPSFEYPDQAARAFQYMRQFDENLRSLYETVTLPSREDEAIDVATVAATISSARGSGKTLLSEHDSKRILSAYGIPCVPTYVAANENEAVRAAETLGFPVVLKLHSETVTHKAAVGGVKLNLANPLAVRDAYRAIESVVTAKVGRQHFAGATVQPMIPDDGYELILGSTIDPQFGPVLLFGSGGRQVEVQKDRALALPPLNRTLARRMMEQTRIFGALRGRSGDAALDLDELERLVVRFSQLVVEQPRIREIDINPLLISSGRIVALDARVILHPPDARDEELPRPAIRPYPVQYVWPGKVRGIASAVTIRPIRPDDETLIARFHQGLSDQSVHQRYGGMMTLPQRVAHERLIRACFTDYDRHIALVADLDDNFTGAHELLGVARLIKLHGRNEAEFSVVVADRYQGRGLGTCLLESLVRVARAERVARVVGNVLQQNRGMIKSCERVGFTLRPRSDNPNADLRAVMVLEAV